MSVRVLLLTTLALLLITSTLKAQDRIFSHETDGVQVQLFLPEGVEVYRGLLLHVANYRMNPSNRWTELARELQFGHVVMQMDMRRNQRPRILAQALRVSLPVLAEKSGHPELQRIPLAGLGHSAGGMALNVLAQTPERMLTTTIDCSWVGNSEQFPELKNTPMLFTLGAIPDGFNMIPAIEERYDPARRKGFLYGLGFEWDKAHTFGNAGTLFAQWIKSVAAERLPEAVNRDEEVKLKDIAEEDGWLGDRETWESHLPTVAPWREYEGDKSKAVWLPDRATAYIWRAYQVRDSPVHLTASSDDGKARLGRFRPRREFQMMTDLGQDVSLGVSIEQDEVKLQKVQYFVGDKRIAEVTEAPYTFTWPSPPQGAHSVFALYTTEDGKQGTTNPGLIVIRKPVKVEVME